MELDAEKSWVMTVSRLDPCADNQFNWFKWEVGNKLADHGWEVAKT